MKSKRYANVQISHDLHSRNTGVELLFYTSTNSWTVTFEDGIDGDSHTHTWPLLSNARDCQMNFPPSSTQKCIEESTERRVPPRVAKLLISSFVQWPRVQSGARSVFGPVVGLVAAQHY